MSEPCWIYWDAEDKENRSVKMQCKACHAKNGLGRLWPPGFGYGPKIICCNCENIIHEGEDEEDQTDI